MITGRTDNVGDFFLHCDECGRQGAVSVDPGMIRFYAHKRRWHTEGDRDYCPTCWAKRQDDAPDARGGC